MFVTRSLLCRTKGSRRSGTAIVELAVSLPLILSVLLGIINSGQIFWVRQIVLSASREGARAFMTRIPNPTRAQQIAERFLGLYFDSTSKPTFIAGNLGQITVTTNPNTSSSTQVQRTVTVQVPISNVLLTGNFLNIWNLTQKVTGSTTFRAEQ